MHTVAVINAGPLVALSLAGQLELLPILFHRTLIPRAVSVKGTAGIMVQAYRRGHVQDLRRILEGMQRDGYFLADAIIEAA
jgi:predicted nucleic acid-binding protein